MRIAVLGAGAVGPAAAALAASRGHAVTLWSPSGRGTAGLADSIIAEGALDGRFPLRIARDLADALAGAEAALLAVPAYAFPALLPLIAERLAQPLLITPAASLAPLALAAMLESRGRAAPPIGAMSTTPVTARRLAPDRVRILGIRAAVDMAAVPETAAPTMGTLATALFGHASPLGGSVVQAAIGNANPIIHAALALTNTTRIEAAEHWPQYGMLTPATCRLMLAMAAERATLACALGVAVPSLEQSLHRATGVPHGPLHAMAAAIAQGGAEVPGPTDPASRYITEDVPYGLAVALWLAARQGVAMPVTDAVVTALEALWGRDLRANPLLEGLRLGADGSAGAARL
ncbi:NAD/NADP octopine/nopaline dehydrogenase family protein [Plastoroseomonas arctica]|uniref:NAD(P)-binding domain-containing protein n=1 Tax=Plastoroseomonas arctica TaxID=1509237 RepID=A0AAF1JYI7_9PROT|nr:NAD/NADP octopine/nopaline dehydrogenase family protein [Plastoroseomonas arctica]MBR0656752.1 NAD(P)-binding domain-containing protein [Plastoroseomonas arctica]